MKPIKAARELNFTNTQLFDYIVESVVNGQRKQAKELIASVRRSRYLNHLTDWVMSIENDELRREMKDLIFKK